MKDTGINMDCGACGKPLSLTAKFCGKCGAPVKRPAPVAADETNTAPMLQPAFADMPAVADSSSTPAKEVEDLVLTLNIAPTDAKHSSMLKIDLDLMVQAKDNAPDPAESAIPAIVSAPSAVNNESAQPVQARSAPPSSSDSQSALQMVSADWLAARELAESDIKQLLEKHSQLLDFISLNSQQLSHFQSLPNPTEQLLREMMEKQTQLAMQLNALQEQMRTSAESMVIKLPDEFKLTLEKQRIELQKSFSQNVAQNASNVEAANQQILERIEALLADNAQTAKSLDSNLAPMSQSFNELKSKLQAIGKKVDETAVKTARIANIRQEEGTEGSGGFIIFIIGLLCGLTVVLSSLAIYNFLSREAAPAAKSAHDASAAGADGGHDKPAHSEAAHATPSKEDAGHGASSSHDKPASDSSSKAKSH